MVQMRHLNKYRKNEDAKLYGVTENRTQVYKTMIPCTNHYTTETNIVIGNKEQHI